MDILVSSNLERLLYEVSGRNAKLIKKRMEDLKKDGRYELTIQIRRKVICNLRRKSAEVNRVGRRKHRVVLFKRCGVLLAWHGPTCAFKDMALTVLPHLLKKGCEICGIKEDVLVLVATSGDTGKAALSAVQASNRQAHLFCIIGGKNIAEVPRGHAKIYFLAVLYLIKKRMEDLKKDGRYELTAEELKEIQETFDGGFADEEGCVEALLLIP